ncbi:hypothetical protein XENORESO_009176 [Xenotaenia resolanae]|uniref:Uncharacterized protein n=1 Tax=Xenotaenia resolanae TaxID=208358 RepID=A0ABV0WWM0_9TELE
MDGRIKIIRMISVAVSRQVPPGGAVSHTVLDLLGSGNVPLLFIQQQIETHFSTVANQSQQNKKNICFNTTVQIQPGSFQRTLHRHYGRQSERGIKEGKLKTAQHVSSSKHSGNLKVFETSEI